MIIKNKGFSLIELIVVVLIISIVGAVSVSNFGNFSDNQNIQNKISDFSIYIKDLDKNVKNNNIIDYKIYLKTGALSYIVSENEQNSIYKQVLSFDNNSLLGTLSISGITFTGSTWYIEIIHDLESDSIISLDGKDEYSYNFASRNNFIINGTLSGVTLNTLKLNYFAKENNNLSISKSNKTYLSAINTKPDKTGTSYTNITIENINNKKFIKDQNGQIIDKVFLFFSVGGKEISLEIGK